MLAAASMALVALRFADAGDSKGFALAPFSADVTVPIGHPLMGGGIAPAGKVVDPLAAHGIVLFGAGQPIVLVAVDWCEIRNAARERWQQVLAAAAQTSPGRVLVCAVHQHDAPVADLEAQQILDQAGCKGAVCDIAFHERAVQTVAAALRDAVGNPRRVTHLSLGQAQVQNIASNRRYHAPDGSLRFDRTSSTRSDIAKAGEPGMIDPWLKSLAFWDADRPLAVISAYAVHPMSYYGQGGVSYDFVGLARERLRADLPGAQCIYFSGASGNVTAGKYNDGAPENRAALADRLYQGMKSAFDGARRVPLDRIELRHTPLRLEPRGGDEFSVAGLQQQLGPDSTPFEQCLAAMGLAWRARADRGHTIDLPVLDFGPAQFVVLPGESYVEYQLMAQRLRPDSFVMVAGYGECATGYVPIEQAWKESDSNLRDWCWVAEGSEARMFDALQAALK